MTETLPTTPFVWVTQDGQHMRVDQMRTTHLFYAVRMIWNHTVPEQFRMPGGIYNGPEKWSVNRRRTAILAMLHELSQRTDLPVALDVQLGIMRDRAAQLTELQLTP